MLANQCTVVFVVVIAVVAVVAVVVAAAVCLDDRPGGVDVQVRSLAVY